MMKKFDLNVFSDGRTYFEENQKNSITNTYTYCGFTTKIENIESYHQNIHSRILKSSTKQV